MILYDCDQIDNIVTMTRENCLIVISRIIVGFGPDSDFDKGDNCVILIIVIRLAI